jgi:hypothetical protein
MKGPAVKTDGWGKNIPEAEWPFMCCCYFGYGCVNLAQADSVMREEALTEIRWIIEALQTPRMSGFVKPHFGEPFSTNSIIPSVFVHGHFLNLAMRYRQATQDVRYDAVIHRVAASLALAFENSPHGILKSYRKMYWVIDNLPALSALARYDQVYQKSLSLVRIRFLQSVKSHYLDPLNGLFCTYIDPDNALCLQGARGISTMYGLHFLKDIDPALATQQYALAKRHFLRTAFGLSAVREFPEGVEEWADVDSGPLVFGLGPSASGFAIGAAAVMGDHETAQQLLKASVLIGMPLFTQDQLEYTVMPPVGQAVIYFGKTLLLDLPGTPKTPETNR